MYQRRGRFPGVSSTSVKLALAVVGGSILFALTRSSWGALLLLWPGKVLHGEIWQLVTYPFIELGPLQVLIDAFVLWSMGSSLELSWGPRRVLGYSFGTTVAAGALTVLLSLVPFFGVLRQGAFSGAMVMVTALWVAYGLSFGRSQTNFFGMPVSGNTLAWIGVVFVVLDGAFNGWLSVVPEVLGLLITWVLFRVGSPRSAWLRFNAWRLQRQLKSRSRHLKVVGQDRNHPSGSDRYLH